MNAVSSLHMIGECCFLQRFRISWSAFERGFFTVCFLVMDISIQTIEPISTIFTLMLKLTVSVVKIKNNEK